MGIALSWNQVFLKGTLRLWHLKNRHWLLLGRIVYTIHLGLTSVLHWYTHLICVRHCTRSFIDVAIRGFQLYHILILMAHYQLTVVLQTMWLCFWWHLITIVLALLFNALILGLTTKTPQSFALAEAHAWRRGLRWWITCELITARGLSGVNEILITILSIGKRFIHHISGY